jgi:hypothetical protein
VALGTKKLEQAKSDISAYDTKKESNIWFIQLFFTIARYEAFTIITERASVMQKPKTARKDKDLNLRKLVKNRSI